MNEKSTLFLPRLPARLDVNQAAEILGFWPHEVSVLLKAGLLKPLGKPARNGHQFFCTAEISALSEDREWLDKASHTVTKHWKDRNRKSNQLG
jgi:predicted transcriptional regulator